MAFRQLMISNAYSSQIICPPRKVLVQRIKLRLRYEWTYSPIPSRRRTNIQPKNQEADTSHYLTNNTWQNYVPEYTAVTPLPHSIRCSTLTLLPPTFTLCLGVIWNLCSSFLPILFSACISIGGIYKGVF